MEQLATYIKTTMRCHMTVPASSLGAKFGSHRPYLVNCERKQTTLKKLKTHKNHGCVEDIGNIE